ncbi:RING finger protein narya-like [Anopheles albimanus]|uniref:RING-type domain-containing protein n=1 Tax=Anopheles albimanus TaxID=7167 RepID=A0A182FI33_ANOAL|nr:RING finger protein narya-like [Anopheles albimanus]
MSRPRWIHCNVCFHLKDQRDRQFYQLYPCHHVICKLCMSKTNHGTVCPICRQSILRFAELNNEMNAKDKMMFDPAAIGALDRQCQNVVFQYKQREHLIEKILRCRNELPRLGEMEDELRKRIVETQRRYEKLRNYRRSLQEHLRKSSPRFNHSGITPQQSGRLSTPAAGHHRSPAISRSSLQASSASGSAHSNRVIDLRCSQRPYTPSPRVPASSATSRPHTETRAKHHAGNDSGISTHTPLTRANFTVSSAGRSSGTSVPPGHRRSHPFLQTPKR